MSEELYELCDNLKREIKQMNQKPDISPTELDRLYKAVDIIKDITTIEAMEGEAYGYSNAMSPYYENGMDHFMGRNSYDGRSMNSGNSYARGRDSMGRYTSRDAAPMHEDKEHLMRQIEEIKAKLDRM